MKKILLVFFCIYFSISCENNNKDLLLHTNRKITTKLEVLDSIKFNNSSENIIGKIGANSIKWGKYFLLTDVIKKQIVVFDSSFNLVKKIGRKGRGPGEYFYSPYFIYDDNNLLLFSPKSKKLNIYNKNLDYIKSKELEQKFIYQLQPALKIFNEFVFSVSYPSSVMKVEYYKNYKSLIVLDSNMNFIKNILEWDKIYHNDKILGYLGTNNKTLLVHGNEDKFYALQKATYYLYELNSNFEIIKKFGLKPKYYKTVPKIVDPIKTQSSYESFVEYKTNVTDIIQIQFDKYTRNLFVEYANITKDEIYKRDSFLSKRYLQIYNDEYNLIFDDEINGHFLFSDKGKIYILEEENPEFIKIKIYSLKKKTADESGN